MFGTDESQNYRDELDDIQPGSDEPGLEPGLEPGEQEP